MEAIVVDTESTARQCIQYLKDQVKKLSRFKVWGQYWYLKLLPSQFYNKGGVSNVNID
jgi:chromosome segregation ATPase